MGIRHPNYNTSSPTQVWFRELANSDVAVVLYNRAAPADTVDITVDLTEVGFSADETVLVYNIWDQHQVGEAKGSYTAFDVPTHGNAFLRIARKANVVV